MRYGLDGLAIFLLKRLMHKNRFCAQFQNRPGMVGRGPVVFGLAYRLRVS
jgi:hypothetical protein